MMFALTLGEQEGIKWFLRAIRADGSYYGEIRFDSPDPNLRIATSISGQISAADTVRLNELVGDMQQGNQPPSAELQFAKLFERLSATDLSQVRLIFVYHRGDESESQAARSFVEFARIIERYLLQDYARLGFPQRTALS